MSTPKEADEEDKMNSVKIMTMHAAKGLEFQNVFMPCCEEQILPHKRSIMDGGSAIEEERRLCYVAMTRGMERLFVSSSVFDSQYDRSMKMPSRFLIEGGLTDKERYAELIQELKDTYVG
jgi:DNA helicase-2/ATP-dependent DNA helicase PcrA